MAKPSSVLVTGGNKGIGLAIARKLGERGYAVWLGCRDEGRGQHAAANLRDAGIDARSVILDVTNSDSVRSAAAHVEKESGCLDALVNNAGRHFGPPPPASGESVDQMNEIFDTNVLGAIRVTQAFLPLLRHSPAARIVMMSSGLGSLTETLDMRSENWNVGFAGYCASKSALNMVTIKFAKELAPEGFKVNAADPGLTSTDLTGHMAGNTPEVAAAVPVALATLGPFGPTGGFYFAGPGGVLTTHQW